MNPARFVLSKSIALQQLETAKKHSDIVSYSLKTNYEVGKVLGENSDCMFSVHSLEELKLLKDCKRAIYFSQAWDNNEISKAVSLGAKSFVVDNETDLETLLGFIEANKKAVSLFLRMKLKENTIHTGKHFVYGMGSSRINKIIPELRKNSLIENLGIHFHRKTQNVSEWSLKEEIETSLSEETLKAIDIMNIGGGIPCAYKNFNESVLDSILKKIRSLKEFLNSKGITMMIEPGRFIAAPAVKLIAQVKLVYGNSIVINCSVYNSAMDTFIANLKLLVEGEMENGNAYTIKGCTPDSMDIFRYKVFLENPKVGDEIVFLNAGAYNFATDFCKLPKLKTEVIR